MWQFVALIAVGLLQLAIGFAGIEHHLGAGWALGALVAAIWFRFLIPLTIGSYFGAVDVMGWDWYVGVLVAAPGLLFALPSMVMAAMDGRTNDASALPRKAIPPSTAPPVPKPSKTAAMEATRRRDPVATSSPSHEPKSKNMTLFNYKNRIERIERLVFPFLELSTPDYGAKGFSPGVIHAGAENVVRFRFAVMNILFEATSGLADRTSVNQEIYNETSSSLSGFMVDIGRLVPQNDCVPGLDFNIRTFRALNRQLNEEDVVTGNLVLKELVNLYGRKSLEWLRKRSKSGIAADGMFLLGMATGKPKSDIVLEAEALRLVAAIFAEPREFDQAIKRSESELQEAFGNKQPSAGLDENSHIGSKSADAGPATKYSGSSEQMPQTKNTTKATPPAVEEYPRAQIAIEYSPVAAEAWKRVQELSESLQERFLSELDQGSVQDVPELLEKLEQEHLRTVRPLDTDDANDALEQARTISAEAEAEFRRAYEVVKLQVTPEDLLAKIEAKFGPSQATKQREAAERKKREEERKRIAVERKRREEAELDRLERVRWAHKQNEIQRRKENVRLNTFIIFGMATVAVIVIFLLNQFG